MGAYSSSEATKMALISAAGTLFAEHGVKAVTTRAIADLAGENIGNIHYHFGGKDGLLDATLEYATLPWNDDPFGKLIEGSPELLETPEGLAELLDKLIDVIFETTFCKRHPSWCGTLVFQILHRNLPASAKVFEKIIKPSIKAFSTIHFKATGDSSSERAHCWYLTLIAPPALLSIDPSTAQKFFPDGKLPPDYLRNLKELCLQNALSGIGLEKARRKVKASKSSPESKS